MKIKILILFLLSLLLSSAYPQENASVITLRDGLVIQNGVIYGRNNIINDPQAEAILARRFEAPREGMIAGKTFSGEDAEWMRITADEEGYFHSEKLRGGALYIEYDSPGKKIMLLNASGHTMVFVNGEPREGDHYGFNFSLHPVALRKGLNQFYFTNGRYPRIRATLQEAWSDIMIKKKDLTLPDLIIEEPGSVWAGATLINASEKYVDGLTLTCRLSDSEITTELPGIAEMTSRRMNFRIPVPGGLSEGEENIVIEVRSEKGLLYDSFTFKAKVKHFASNHDRTFISKIDGSVQYYSVTPGTEPREKGQALFLSVHGAGVQARNQAWTYDAKDWGHIVAPTNRGPFGFAWEDWGRLDALEVLEEGRKLFQTSPEKTFLTGHSMGGHGTWYLGATYPDRFAAIAPCAGYPDLLNYASREPGEEDNSKTALMFRRAGMPSRTIKLARNYIHHGVFVYHGDSDPTVSVEQARYMRSLLGEFHPDFTYYEYPGGTHWFGDISMDWPPIFDYFKLHSIPASDEVRKLEFYTASPGVSSSSHWLCIYQQTEPFETSMVKAVIGPDSSQVSIETQNVMTIGLKLGDMSIKYPLSINIDDMQFAIDEIQSTGYYYLRRIDGKWSPAPEPGADEKGPHRYGGFKDAFRKEMIFVYGTGGNAEEDRLNYLKARFDAETFSYRGNGSVEIVSDRQFLDNDYPGRNIIVYGNADNNLAWDSLLDNSPVQVYRGKAVIGERTISGDDLALYIIRPREGSETNSVGVIAGTGLPGMQAAYPNQYFIAGPAFPDLTVFRMPGDGEGYKAVECAGFFANDWSVKEGNFAWKKD